ncbi:MAG: hypothetical protein HRT37_20525 [Alteromonadaceae bacterium]|nr:hypothetical protein [Alteromonadaceae bacterium]
MILKKILLLTCLIFMSHNSNADVFAGYDSFCGLPVVVGSDLQTATARTDKYGNKFIHIDPKAMSNWTTSRMFTLAHECAHHLIGHTTPLGQKERYYGGTSKQELEADCWAARKLESIGVYRDIDRAILDNAKQGHFSSGGYPTGMERAQNIINCVEGGGDDHGQVCENEIQQCYHEAHSRGDKVDCSHPIQAHSRGDIVPCQHQCQSQWGWVPCHNQGDVIPCQHVVPQHRYDLVGCEHVAHPRGHLKQVCN